MNPLLTLLLILRLVEPGLTYDVYEGVPYKTLGLRALRADVYTPAGAPEPAPAVVFVHGGMWDFGQRTDNADLARFVASAGLAAVLIDFRDASTSGFEGQIEDIKAAVRWVRANADLYNLDPERIGIFGSSSGAHLASLVAFADNGEGFGDDPAGASSRVNACLLLYGVYDLAAVAANGGLQAPFATWYVGGDVNEHPELFARYSTPTYVDGSEPPTLLIHGTDDIMAPYEQAEALETCLATAGVPVELMPAPGLGHGFVRKQPWLRPWMAQVITDFFLEELKED